MTPDKSEATLTPAEVLADIATKLKAAGGEVVLSGILSHYLLTDDPKEDRVATACEAIVKMATVRAETAAKKAADDEQ